MPEKSSHLDPNHAHVNVFHVTVTIRAPLTTCPRSCPYVTITCLTLFRNPPRSRPASHVPYVLTNITPGAEPAPVVYASANQYAHNCSRSRIDAGPETKMSLSRPPELGQSKATLALVELPWPPSCEVVLSGSLPKRRPPLLTNTDIRNNVRRPPQKKA